MEKISKRVLACLLAALMLLSAVPFSVFAADSATHTHNYIYAQGKIKVTLSGEKFTVGNETYKCSECSATSVKSISLSDKLTNVAKEAKSALESPECKTYSDEYFAVKSAYEALVGLAKAGDTHTEQFIEARIADTEKAVSALKNASKDSVAKTFTVKFIVKDKDGKDVIAKKEEVYYSAKATAPATVNGYSDSKNHYTFKKWNVSFNSVKSDLIVTAVYDSAAHAFNTVSKAKQDATCTEKGNHEEKKCSCGYTTGGEVIDALGHSWGAPSSDTLKRTTTKTCTRCKTTHTEHVIYTDHKLVNHEAKAATCTADGNKAYSTCETCDYSNFSSSDVIPAKGHTEVVDAAKAATCTENGLTEGRHCSACNAVLVPQQTLRALGHDYSKKVLDNAHRKSIETCESAAVYYYGCTRCDSKSADKTFTDGKAKGHDFSAELVDEARLKSAASCETPATYYKTCKTCKAISKEDTFTSGNALGHDWDKAVANADGKTETKTCKRCKATSTSCKADDKGVVNHTFEAQAAKAATCTADGWNAYKLCTTCGQKEGYTVIPAGHTVLHDETYVAKIATCLSDGEKVTVAYCADKNCGKLVKEEKTAIASLGGHKFGAAVKNSDGTETKVCPACGFSETECKNENHPPKITPAVDPTCTKDGLTEGKKCSICGEILEEQLVVSALGHKEEKLAAVAPTCTKDGLKEGKKCSVCGEILVAQEVDPKKGHTEETIPAVPATCSKTGLSEGKKCSVCGEILVAQTEVPMTAHTEVEISAVNPTCTAKGMTAGKKCSVCGTVTEEPKEVPALGHDIVTDAEALPATCLVDGRTKGEHCTRCDYKVVSEVIKAVGHHTEEEVPATPPTCTEDGTTAGKKCSVCGEVLVEYEVLPALGHAFDVVTTKATTAKDGSIVKTCSTCGTVESTAIPRIATVVLTKAVLANNGKTQTPAVVIRDAKNTALVNGVDYEITYANNNKVGKASVTVKFIGDNYSGTKVLYFTITPAATAKVAAKQTSKAINVSWSAVAGASGYRVQLFKGNKLVRTVTVTGRKATFKKLSKGTNYKVVVTSFVTVDGKNVFGASRTLLTATKCAMPTNVKLTAGNKKVNVKWKKVAGATGYTISYSLKKNGAYKTVTVNAKRNAWNIKNLKSGRAYYIKVTANKRVGKTVIRSIPSKLQSVTVK